MNGQEIQNIIRSDPLMRQHFSGIYSRDEIKFRKMKDKSFILLNLAASTDALGTHWVLISSMEDGFIDFFDTFGRKPSYIDIINFMMLSGKKLRYSPFQLQHALSQQCGPHCLYVAWLLSRGLTMKEITSDFYRESPYLNDCYVREIIRIVFDVPNMIPVFYLNFLAEQYKNESIIVTYHPRGERKKKN